MPSPDKPRYWFSAKRYGWGWGPPATWQGWVVLLIYLALVLGGISLVRTPKGVVVYVVYVLVLTFVLIAICWIKGEPPRWRWGDDDS